MLFVLGVVGKGSPSSPGKKKCKKKKVYADLAIYCLDGGYLSDPFTGPWTSPYIKTHGSVSCGPRKTGRAQTGVSILTGTTKTRFSRIHRSVIFYPKITKFAVELPAYKGTLHTKIEVNRASRFRDTSEQSFIFCSSFFFLLILLFAQTQKPL